jgi:hypothetical protein
MGGHIRCSEETTQLELTQDLHACRGTAEQNLGADREGIGSGSLGKTSQDQEKPHRPGPADLLKAESRSPPFTHRLFEI